MARLHYKATGKGLPVILIHGFCETHEIWNHIVGPLASEFRILTVDLPGFGRSEPLPSPHSIDDVADVLIDFIANDLGLDSCVALGHSLGGYVTLSMAHKVPGLFSAIGLIHSTAFADTDERKASRNKVIEFINAHGAEPFIRSFIPPLFFDSSNNLVPAVVDLALRTPAQTIISYSEAMRDRSDRSDLLRTYSKPVLFLAGAKDAIIPLEAVERQVAMTKEPMLVVLERVAHMGMIEDQVQTIDSIQRFLRSS